MLANYFSNNFIYVNLGTSYFSFLYLRDKPLILIAIMKKFILSFALLCPAFAYSQVIPTPEPAKIELRLNDPAKDKLRVKGSHQILIGAVLNSVGLGVGLIGPMFVSEPANPTTQYLHELRMAGNNPTAIKNVSNNYQEEMVKYNDKLASNDNKKDALRLAGFGVFSIGCGFNIAGILNLTK